MGGFNPSQPKKFEGKDLPATSAETVFSSKVTETEIPKFIYSDEGNLMPTEMADRYYGTLGRPLEQREIRPRKHEEKGKSFTTNEVVIMAAATADMVANEVELKLATNSDKELAGELIDPSVERRGIKVMKKLSESLDQNATPAELLAAITKYVQDLEKMFDEGRVDPLHSKYFEGELLAAQSAMRRLGDINYAISWSANNDYTRLIEQHNDNLKRAALASAGLEIARNQSKTSTQASSVGDTSPDTEAPLRDRPMTDAEIETQKELVTKLFAERKKESPNLVPVDDIDRIKFAKDFFGETQGSQARALPVTPRNVDIFREYFLKELQKNGRMAKTARGRMSSHLSGILGSQLGQPMPPGGPKRFAYEIVLSSTIGKGISPEEFNEMNARQFAKDYLDIDINEVMPDYDSMFF